MFSSIMTFHLSSGLQNKVSSYSVMYISRHHYACYLHVEKRSVAAQVCISRLLSSALKMVSAESYETLLHFLSLLKTLYRRKKVIFAHVFPPLSSDVSSVLLSLKPSGYVFCLTANNLLHSEIC